MGKGGSDRFRGVTCPGRGVVQSDSISMQVPQAPTIAGTHTCTHTSGRTQANKHTNNKPVHLSKNHLSKTAKIKTERAQPVMLFHVSRT